MIAAYGSRRLTADIVAPTIRGQRRIGDARAQLAEFFVYTHQVALAALEQLEDLLVVPLGSFGPLQRRRFGLARHQHTFDRTARYLQRPGDGAYAMTRVMERQDGCPIFLIEHLIVSP